MAIATQAHVSTKEFPALPEAGPNAALTPGPHVR
jgi:hypothetical protein